ncbi:MAG TPA: MoxR family ATPase [Chloroflexota bacterium]|nr:MoxR family ATPase [Chloroflexota bacterium]
MIDATELELTPQDFTSVAQTIEDEIGRVIVGQREVVHGILICVLAGGHVLLEGVPGLGKTMLIRTLAEVLDVQFSRIQFTPDLMPGDITGSNIIVDDHVSGTRRFQFQPGPVFANLILADEINRATPKTQSALLEAMQERQVTVARQRHVLQEPFFVMATQNPIEMEGTYPLPEAQVDRFLFKLTIGYPSQSELVDIINRTTVREMPHPKRVATAETVLRMIVLARDLPIAQPVVDYVARLVMATHPGTDYAGEASRHVRFGSSPRGAQSIVIAAKIHAMLQGRYNVAFEDVRFVALPALRHRIILNFEAEADGVTSDSIIRDILHNVPENAR